MKKIGQEIILFDLQQLCHEIIHIKVYNWHYSDYMSVIFGTTLTILASKRPHCGYTQPQIMSHIAHWAWDSMVPGLPHKMTDFQNFQNLRETKVFHKVPVVTAIWGFQISIYNQSLLHCNKNEEDWSRNNTFWPPTVMSWNYPYKGL